MTAAIILAAGESSRLGKPKQNLVFEGQTLLERTISSTQQSRCNLVIVVLGANADKINPVADIIILYNQEWQEGMASSIRIAIKELNQNNLINNVVFLLCDQPFVSAELLNSMIN